MVILARITYVKGTVSKDVILLVRRVVDGQVPVSERLEQIPHDVVQLHEVALAIGRGNVGGRKASLHLVGVWRVVGPGRRPAIGNREVRVGRVPVKTAIDSSSTTQQAASKDVNI